MMTWALQRGNDDSARIANACLQLGIPFCEFSSRPFTEDLPNVAIDDGPVVFYGSPRISGLVAKAGLWLPGVFGHPELFDFDRQMAAWRSSMLNADAALFTLSDLVHRSTQLAPRVFYRPATDAKEFGGGTATNEELQQWANQVIDRGFGGLAQDTVIVVGPERHLGREWRLVIVQDAVVASSQYRNGGVHEVKSGAPSEVIDFGTGIASVWSPHPVFVLDVTEADGELFVVEANGFNSCGFYDSDTLAIVESVSNYVANSQ